jgi:hypothetical protein
VSRGFKRAIPVNITLERQFDSGLAPTELAPQEMTLGIDFMSCRRRHLWQAEILIECLWFQTEAAELGLVGRAVVAYVARRAASLRPGGDLSEWLTDTVRSIYSDVVDELAARAARKAVPVEPEAEAPTPAFDRWSF